jgi:hypothetical protein
MTVTKVKQFSATIGSGEAMVNRDQMESLRLQAAITDIQAMIYNSGASARSSTSMLVKMLNDAKQELIGVEARSHQHNEEERRKIQAEVAAVVYLVAQETALNELEREQYGAFISREFFTKTDFDDLEKFYTYSWDKLTDGGKAQMSQRVWEGVRRHEYEFTELPDSVKEKEAQRIHDMLSGISRIPPEMNRIPQTDRTDFVTAWHSGRKEAAYNILDRPSFAENVVVLSRPVLEKSGEDREWFDPQALTDGELGKVVKKPSPSDSLHRDSDNTLSGDLLANLDSGASKPTALPLPQAGINRSPR